MSDQENFDADPILVLPAGFENLSRVSTIAWAPNVVKITNHEGTLEVRVFRDVGVTADKSAPLKEESVALNAYLCDQLAAAGFQCDANADDYGGTFNPAVETQKIVTASDVADLVNAYISQTKRPAAPRVAVPKPPSP